MSKILVLGSGLIGLSTVMMLARRDHDVTMFERNSEHLLGSRAGSCPALRDEVMVRPEVVNRIMEIAPRGRDTASAVPRRTASNAT